MSYLVLARKLRPQTFDQVVGQGSVVRTLQNAIKKNRVAHAMVFSGVRGVGKTTLARIMAKAINCDHKEASPCDKCSSCQEIKDGKSLDLYEIDGASNRGIEEIRELKENIRFQPAKFRYKIIIIDEVHMLTTPAFNALLKTLEEPPEHVFFIFATTELHKVPVTILSRCQRYELKRVSYKDLFTFFRKISDDEGVDISDVAIEMITREAGGSVRDGLSLLDQIFSFGGDKIDEKDVIEVLGLVDSRVFSEIAVALLQNNLPRCLELMENSYNQGIDIKRFAGDLLSYFRSLIIAKVSGKYRELIDGSDHESKTIKETAVKYSVETLTNSFNLMFKGVEEMQRSSHPKMALEVAFMKIVSIGDIVPAATLLERLLSVSGSSENIETVPGLTVETKESGRLPSDKKKTRLVIKDDQDPSSHESEIRESVEESVSDSRKEQDRRPDVEKEEAVVSTQLKTKEVRKHWEGFIAHVKDRKPWMAHALSLCQSAREDGNALVLKYDDGSDCKILQGAENIKLLNEFALDFFQKDLKISITTKSGTLPGDEGEDQNLPQDERRALANDPLVKLTTEVLGGQVSEIRIGPRSR